jgi:SAM-dependent methyltransferase
MATYDRDDFWEAFAPSLFEPSRLQRAAEEAGALVRLLQIAPPARVLDLCSGPGAHAIELARRGFTVTGVDRTRAYLERARAAGARVEWVEADMREFRREGAFEAALNIDTSFGCLDGDDDDRRVIANLRASLGPGGVLALALDGREVVRARFRERGWVQVGANYFLREGRPAPDWSFMDTRWIILGGGGAQEFVVRTRLYTAEELTALLAEGGFAQVSLFGDFDGQPYRAEAKRLVAVAR